MNAPLIFIPKPNPSASIRLLCFAYAGGSSATYISWQNYLTIEVELAVIQLPGHGVRLLETPYQTMTEIINALYLAFKKLSNKPFIFYGHSMGARVAYEFTLMLHQLHSYLPVHFIASGSVAPSIPRKKEQIYHLPDSEFIEKLQQLNGSSPEVLANNELMQLMLPALRADFKIIETYCNHNRTIIPTKISILAGDNDDMEKSDIEAWFELFETYADIHWVSGDHFFVDKNKIAVLKIVNNIINEKIVLSSS